MKTPSLARSGFTYIGGRNAFDYGGIWIRVEAHGWYADAIEIIGADQFDTDYDHPRALIEHGSICLERRPPSEWRRILKTSGVPIRELRRLPRDKRHVWLAEAVNSYCGFDRACDAGEWVTSETAAYRIVRAIAARL